MSKNKLYTLSYFKKRLIDAGYHVKVLIPKFLKKGDDRKWLISIMSEHKHYPIFCLCIKKEDEYRYLITDNNLFMDREIMTSSMNVIINNIRELDNSIWD